jgi:cell division protein ZapA (FtsZ GTPase activity inhibitor)
VSEATPVNITIRGKALRVRSTQSHDALQSIADYVEATMQRVERGTSAVDSLDVAMLTALNLAREVIESRDQSIPVNDGRLRDLIDRAEAALGEGSA